METSLVSEKWSLLKYNNMLSKNEKLLGGKFTITAGIEYFKENWNNEKTQVPLKCNDCGFEFSRSLESHRRGFDCRSCLGKAPMQYKQVMALVIGRTYKFQELVNEEWWEINYKNTGTRVPITCTKCGHESSPILDNILRANPKHPLCKPCSNVERSKSTEFSREQFLDRTKEVHLHGLWDYSMITEEWWDTNYAAARGTKRTTTLLVPIICKKHGVFGITISSHLQGHGCQSCSESNGEKHIRGLLTTLEESFQQEKTFELCLGSTGSKLRFDFFLPDHKILIEYDGLHHFESIDFFGGEKLLETMKNNDLIKNKFAEENNLLLYRIPYWEFDNIPFILKTILRQPDSG